jgi:hypothetical protein
MGMGSLEVLLRTDASESMVHIGLEQSQKTGEVAYLCWVPERTLVSSMD